MRQRHMSLQKKFANSWARRNFPILLHRVNTEIKYTILYDQTNIYKKIKDIKT